MGEDPRHSTAASLADARLPPFYRCIHLAQTGSTNDEAKRLAGEGAAEGTLIWADSQTMGRGRRGRLWQSPAGNLYVSIILRPDAAIGRVGQLGFAASLAIAEIASALLSSSRVIQCKWPNDVLIDGRKTAGLLLEMDSRGDGKAAWLVLGIGINVENHPDDTEFPATSLAAAGGKVEVAEVLSLFAQRFHGWYEMWRRDGFAPLRAAWLRRAAGLGGPITVRLENTTIDGVFSGLDEDGALLLHSAGLGAETPARRITAGDVFFPTVATAIRTQAG